MRYLNFLKSYISSFLLICFAVIVINLVVDPYGAYGLVSLEGLNRNKPATLNNSRFFKPFIVRSRQVKSLAMGSSRVGAGIDPGHVCWPEELKPTYNYGLPGVTIDEVFYRFESISEELDLSRLVLGLDFYMFRGSSMNLHDPEQEDRWSFYQKSLFSTSSLQSSITTLFKQDVYEHPGVLPTGQGDWEAGRRRVDKHGHRKDFLAYEKTILIKNYDFHGTLDDYCVDDEGRDQIVYFQKLLELCRAKDIKLTIFLSPLHARRVLAFDQAGIYTTFEDWKRRLLEVIVRVYGEKAAEQVVVWDFSAVSPYTAEVVPPLEARGVHMKYYWESSHYKKILGDLMLCRMFDCPAPGGEELSDFGDRLEPGNIEAVLALQRRKLESYAEANAADLQDLYALKGEVARLKEAKLQ